MNPPSRDPSPYCGSLPSIPTGSWRADRESWIPACSGAVKWMPTLGTRIGRYEILSLIGTGGMGEVYRAYDSTLSRDVAIPRF
jgi:serine/threonine protein kinase